MASDAEMMRRVVMGNDATEDEPEDGHPSFVEGVISSIGADGIIFTVPGWDSGKFSFGPVPYAAWTITGGGTPHGPVAGDACLILFPAGGGNADLVRPWVLGWWAS